MPNHITNILKVNGSDEQVKNVFAHIKTERSEFDFNKIIPMPEELNIASSTDGSIGMEYLLFKSGEFRFKKYEETYKRVESYDEKRKNEIIELGKKYLCNLAKYGYTNWYNWRIANWGTKWNAYDIEMIDDYTIEFDTAWSGVPDLICVLSTMFPEVSFEYIYADEDVSYNTGVGYFKNGTSEIYYPEMVQNVAFEIYFKTHEWARDYYEFVDGEWKSKED